MLNLSQLRERFKLQLKTKEREWVEFKLNNSNPQEIGEYISALANSAALCDESCGYVCWGGEDETRRLAGTTFQPSSAMHDAQELENWLSIHLQPRIDFRFHEFLCDGVAVVLLEIPAAWHCPVKFRNEAYIRVGSYKKHLAEHPEKEKSLWHKLSRVRFENSISLVGASSDDVLRTIDYPAYFDLMRLPLPDNRVGILNRLCEQDIVSQVGDDAYDITNLGGILFAKRLADFSSLARKAVRVIVYRGIDRVTPVREQPGSRGYAAGFEGLVRYIHECLPQNEQIGEAFRTEVPVYPLEAIREFVANALIHQDFSLGGSGPMIEVFDDRMEITNPGTPLIAPERFIDNPPRSRNEDLAGLMKMVHICEERGHGIDRALFKIEHYQLPPPEFVVYENHTKVVMLAPRPLSEMDSQQRIRACYQHACLQYVSNRKLTNETLRKRFALADDKHAITSRIIKDAVDAGLIKAFGSQTRKFAKYVPIWA